MVETQTKDSDLRAAREQVAELTALLRETREVITEAVRYSHIGHDYNFRPAIEKIDTALARLDQAIAGEG